jgi:hypothetical protein
MAYITTEQVKEIRTQLKQAFPRLKFSVKKINYSKVSVTIKSGDIDFLGALKKENERDYITVWNNYKNQFIGEEVLKSVEKINNIVYGQGWYDNSDSMIDYFDTAYYVDIRIGDYEEPYVLNQKRAA